MVKKNKLTRYVTNIISFANSRGKNKFKDRSLLYFSGRVDVELLKLMTAVWQPIVGLNKEIVVFRVVRPKNVRKLGISLFGSTTEPRPRKPIASTSTAVLPPEIPDFEEEEISKETPSRHFVYTVLPNGLFASSECLKPGDELLQVNGYRLHGRSHVEVVRCLRCLPPHIELVIARSSPNFEAIGDMADDASIYFDESSTTLHVAASEIGSVATSSFLDDSYDGSASNYAGFSPVGLPTYPSASRVSEWIRGPQREISGTLPKGHGLMSPMSSRALSTIGSDVLPPASTVIGENATHKIVWSSVPLIVMLKRDKPDFGFSISSYDESLFGGSSTVHRTNTLKRALSLRRRSTVATNLSSPRSRYSTIDRSQSISAETLPRSSRNTLIIINEIVPGSCVDLDGRIKVGDRLLFVNDKKLTRASIGGAANALTSAPLGYTMIGVSKMFTAPNDMFSPRFSMSSPQFTAVVNSTDDGTVTLKDEEHRKDHPLDYYTPLSLEVEEVPYHSAGLVVPEMDPADEKKVIVSSETLPLGIELDALAAGGVDGCRVAKVLRGGSVELSAALVPGDYITRINSDNLRKVTNAEAFRVLHKASECTSIEIAYFPGEKVVSHRVKHFRPKFPEPEKEDYQFNGSSVLLVDLPPPELILSTDPLTQLCDESAQINSAWTQTRELKLLKLPNEDTWGISVTGPDVWTSGGDIRISALPRGVTLPVFVASIDENSAAGRCGLLQPGDIIIGVNGMDATHVGSRRVAEWIQTANLVSSNSDESSSCEDWTFLYLLILPLNPSLSNTQPSFSGSNSSYFSISTKAPTNLQTIPPVALGIESSVPSGDNSNGRPLSYVFNSSTLVRSAFVSSNDSSMEEPTSVASLEQHGDLPEPLGFSNLMIAPPEEPLPMPPLPPQPSNDDVECPYGNPTDYAIPPPPPQFTSSDVPSTLPVVVSTIVTKPPFPSVQTVESQSAWRNIGASQLTASLSQLTQTYRRSALADDEIHVVTMCLTPLPTKSSSEPDESLPADCESGLGIRLVGHRDTNSRGVFICSLRECSLADRTPGLQVTDEIVQVNNVCVMGLTHVSAKLLISKEAEMARKSGVINPKIMLVIRHNAAYNASVMAKPAAGTAPTGCSHFLHHSSLRSASQEKPCLIKNKTVRPEYDYFDVTLERNSQGGLGLYLVNLNPRGDMGVYVQNFLQASPAGKSGMVRCWDQIVAIDGKDVEDYDSALAKLSTIHPSVNLRLARIKPNNPRSEIPGRMILPRSFSPYNQPTPILLGVETTVEIIRSDEELGFAIVGGTDSEINGVFIEKIYKGGTIDKDGRLKPQDRIIAVNNIDLRNVTHTAATSALRATKDRLLLTILRGSGALPFPLSDVMQTFNVTLQKQPEATFGLDLDNNASGGVVINGITPGSVASRTSVLHTGDVILEVDGLDVHKASSNDVIAMLRQCATHVLLKTGRLRPPSGQPIPRLRLFTVLLSNQSKAASTKCLGMSVSAPVLGTDEQQSVSDSEQPNIYGLILRPATGSEKVYAPGNLIIERIQPNSPAARCGMLQVGDRLLGIDREPVGWLKIEDLEKFCQNLETLTLDFGRLPPSKCPTAKSSPYKLPLDYSPSPIRALPTVKEADEVVPAEEPSSLKDIVEDKSVPNIERAPSPVTNVIEKFDAFNLNGNNDFDEDDSGGNSKIRQIQLPLSPRDSKNAKLGLTLQANRTSLFDQRVIHLLPGSAADVSGLRVGDRIIGFQDRLLFALSQDPATIAQTIESMWRSYHDAPVTLTILRDAPRQLKASDVAAPSVGFDGRANFLNFKHIVGPAATGLGLVAAHHHINSRRLPKDAGDNLDVQLQGGPPGLLNPNIATSYTARTFHGGANDYMGQPYCSSTTLSVIPDLSTTLPESTVDINVSGESNQDLEHGNTECILSLPTDDQSNDFRNGGCDQPTSVEFDNPESEDAIFKND